MQSSSGKITVQGGSESRVLSDTEIPALLRQVLAEAASHAGRTWTGPAPAGGREEVLEVEIAGQLYTVTWTIPTESPALITLSPREKEIVRLVAKGLPNKAIASVLEISAWTVATHLRRIFTKLEVNSRAEMVARAIAASLLAGSESATPPP